MRAFIGLLMGLILPGIAGLPQARKAQEAVVTVLNSVTGEPVKKAHVLASCKPGEGGERFLAKNSEAFTDSMGRAQLPGVAIEECRLTVSRQGYWPVEDSGDSRKTSATAVDVKLEPYARISGRLVDATGEPLTRVRIGAWKVMPTDRGLVHSLSAWTVANDRGDFLVSYLRRGVYYLQLTGAENTTRAFVGEFPPAIPAEVSPMSYYGGSNIETAVPVRVEAGGSARVEWKVDLRPERLVEGRLTNHKPYGESRIEVRTAKGERVHCFTSIHAADGRFRIHGLNDGEYSIRIQQGGSSQPQYAMEYVSVSGRNVSGLEMTLYPTSEVTGILEVESSEGRSTARPPFVVVVLNKRHQFTESRDAGMQGEARGGVFTIRDVPPGEYELDIPCSGGYVSGLKVGMQDLLKDRVLRIGSGTPLPPIEISVRTDGGTVQANLKIDGSPRIGYITLAPIGPPEGRRNLGITRPNSSNSFRDVPPGAYQIVAWEPNTQNSAEVLRKAAQRAVGQTIVVTPGSSQTVEITHLAEVRE